MCNIAGYTGTRPAAPILLEMLRRQEGLCGGYYTGIATVHEGKIHYAKLAGDVARLEETTARAMAEAFAVLRRADADAAGLKGRAGLTDPLRWTALSRAWEKTFSELTPEITVKLTLAQRC